MGVIVADEGDSHGIDPGELERFGDAVLDALGLGDAELSVVLCDDAFIQPLNRDWRDVDAPTDVLSFPQEEAIEPGRFERQPEVLGDVVISTETAARQAASLGHPLTIELRVLLVHGVLHLVGYDHEEDGDAVRMQAEESRLLALVGIDAAAALIARAG